VRTQDSVRSVSWRMSATLLALCPGVLAQVLIFGADTLVHLAIAALVATAVEALASVMRGDRAITGLQDGSAAITAVLVAVAIPAGAPWWVTAVATGAGLMLAKHLYGGLGHNLFNPAMAGYAIALVSFPEEMTRWYGYPILGEEVREWLLGAHASTGATPLDHYQAEIRRPAGPDGDFPSAPFGPIGLFLVAGAYALGGVGLVLLRVIHWRMPAAFVAGLGVAAVLSYAISAGVSAGPWFHLLNGATAVVAFFVVTDPVTAPVCPTAQWCFAGIVGVLTVVIRVWGEYAEGAAFAVLAGNMLAPALDRWLVPLNGSQGR
jgi:electron transport complex protein RnfD